MAEPPAGAAGERLARWIGPLLCAAIFVGLAAWSWRKWPDILVDFGHELYVPWQLTEGKVLYRDIAFLHGPFSQYLNAIWFQLFGVSLTTLIFCNLAILAGMTCLIYRMLADACDRFTATVGCLFLLLVFSFSQYLAAGNYNFVCPYSHEATHGTALVVAMIFCLSRGKPCLGLIRHFLAGLCFGCVSLTRADVSFAACAVVLIRLALRLLALREAVRPDARAVLAFFVAAAVPALGFFLYFWSEMPAVQAMKAVVGAWALLLTRAVADNAFHEAGLGLDDVRGNAIFALKAFCGLVLGTAAAAGADLALRRSGAKLLTRGLIGGLAVFAILLWRPAIIPWGDIGRPLPLTSLIAWLGLLLALFRQRYRPDMTSRLKPLILWSTFALLLLGKMILNARLHHYGFYLAMPATLTLIVSLLWAVPLLLDRFSSRGLILRCLVSAVMAAAVLAHVRVADSLFAQKDWVVGRGGDAIYTANPRLAGEGVVVRGLLEQVTDRTPADATLAVLPEGVMVNYLARRVNPTPYTTFMMTELLAFGEDAILAGFQRHPPDFIALIPRNTEEFGVGLFGTDPRYGLRIMQWINAEYESFLLLGPQPPSDSGQYGVKIMRRRVAAPVPASATSPTMK